MTRIKAYPESFPMEGDFSPGHTALLVIDVQTDFCGPGGYLDQMGVDLTPLRKPIEPIRRVLAAMRGKGCTVVHTRETFSPDLSDVQPHRRYRGQTGDAVIPGDEGPLGRSLIKGEPCWEIVPEVAPLPGEAIFDKRAYGAFGCTGIGEHLESRGVRHLVLTGLTTDCCIQSNLREALDRGYECLVLEDCCGASRQESHERSMALIRHAYAVFGCVSNSSALLQALAD